MLPIYRWGNRDSVKWLAPNTIQWVNDINIYLNWSLSDSKTYAHNTIIIIAHSLSPNEDTALPANGIKINGFSNALSDQTPTSFSTAPLPSGLQVYSPPSPSILYLLRAALKSHLKILLTPWFQIEGVVGWGLGRQAAHRQGKKRYWKAPSSYPILY